ncbi:MAG: hypothetical protein OEV40_26345, partial [Acidimicrobiia bacterium]|nr:hypothetical protein [Acidimicrobiia bacterium]
MHRRRRLPLVGAGVLSAALLVVAACGLTGGSGTVDGADRHRTGVPSIDKVSFADVAADVGLEFRHGAFQWQTGGDPAAMMGGGVCWLDYDGNGWL